MTVFPRIVRRVSMLAALAVVALLTSPPQGAGGTPPSDPVIVAVGDIACQSPSKGDGSGACESAAVADLIRSIAPDRFLALGDLQYNKGSLAEFERVWDAQFGDLRGITMPAPGNHEYATPDAQGYFDYWGAAASPPLGYYSFDVGGWHVVSLNTEICDDGCGPGSAQYEWLASDLAAHSDATCTLAFGHHPRYDWRPWNKWVDDADEQTQFSGSETRPLIPLWELMYANGVDVVLVGHNHIYHRWAAQDAHRNAVADGTVQFTVGTGGRSLYPLGTKPRPENLVAVQNKAFGVLKLTLHETSYDYEWVSAEGEPAFTDAATGVACH
jgi:hypothetical protein